MQLIFIKFTVRPELVEGHAYGSTSSPRTVYWS